MWSVTLVDIATYTISKGHFLHGPIFQSVVSEFKMCQDNVPVLQMTFNQRLQNVCKTSMSTVVTVKSMDDDTHC